MKPHMERAVDFEDFKDVTELAEYVRNLPFNILAVMPGTECGVELADFLAEELDMPNRNGTALMTARTDKAEMQERLRACGVPAALQTRSSEAGPLIEWAREHNHYPVVAKPVRGAGSDGIFFCNCEEDISRAFDEVVGSGRKNLFGESVPELALQEFLEGDEYIIDTVSFEGKHLCVGLWVYKKKRGLDWNPTAIIPEYSLILPSDGAEQSELTSYVFRVLDAVGLRFGACHTEVMMTPRGPVLVEVNTRMHGLQGPLITEFATGTNIATYTADVMVSNGELFKKLYAEASPKAGRWLYPLQKEAFMVLMISSVEGQLNNDFAADVQKLGLPSLYDVVPMVKPGETLHQTVDLATGAGVALMVHESREQLVQDIDALRSAERSGLYCVQ